MQITYTTPKTEAGTTWFFARRDSRSIATVETCAGSDEWTVLTNQRGAVKVSRMTLAQAKAFVERYA